MILHEMGCAIELTAVRGEAQHPLDLGLEKIVFPKADSGLDVQAPHGHEVLDVLFAVLLQAHARGLLPGMHDVEAELDNPVYDAVDVAVRVQAEKGPAILDGVGG